MNTSFNFQDWYARDTMITARYLVYPKVANKILQAGPAETFGAHFSGGG
jgi:hypothetical protein